MGKQVAEAATEAVWQVLLLCMSMKKECVIMCIKVHRIKKEDATQFL